MTAVPSSPVTTTLRQLVAPYAKANHRRAWWQVATTLLSFALLWAAIAATLERSGGWSLVLLVPLAGLYIRLFIIQHDCGHGSFFARATLNHRLGAVLGVVTLFPYGYWHKTHAIHHATSGNLDRREFGDIETLTVREYQSRGWWGRVALPLLPQHAGAARHRAAVPVRDQASLAIRPAAHLEQGMGQRNLEQPGAARGRHGAVPGGRLENRAAACTCH